MTLILSGTDGLSDVDGSAATPAIRGTDANTGIFFGADIIGFAEGGTEAMRIDSSGNVGIGVTPSAWVSSTALQVGPSGSVAGNSALPLIISANAYGTTAGFVAKYITSNYATTYLQYQGEHRWNTAPSGTAGNTISFNQAMTLDASGNLLVGTTSNYVGEANFVESKNGYVFAANNTGSANNRNWLMSTNGSAAGVLDFIPSSTNTGWANASYAMTLTSAGNLTILGATATKASGTTWANPSDQRLKDNIRDYAKGTTELMQVRVREWEYNGKGGTTEGMKGLGVIADEVMIVLPDTVENYDAKLNADDEETTAIKKFDATEITWLLVKTVQEQQATITTLTDRITALENK